MSSPLDNKAAVADLANGPAAPQPTLVILESHGRWVKEVSTIGPGTLLYKVELPLQPFVVLKVDDAQHIIVGDVNSTITNVCIEDHLIDVTCLFPLT